MTPKEQSFSVSEPAFPLKYQSSARSTVDLPAPFGPMNVVTESKGIVTSFNVRKFLMRTDWIFIVGSSSLSLLLKTESRTPTRCSKEQSVAGLFANDERAATYDGPVWWRSRKQPLRTVNVGA